MTTIIHSLLPFKEFFTEANAGAVALNVKDGFTKSRFAETAVVFGREVNDATLSVVSYQGLALKHALIYGKNLGLARGYLDHIRLHGKPDLLEVHGRLQVAAYISTKRPDLALGLYLHNDPRNMKGGETPQKRKRLLERMSVIYCVSNYLKGCFLENVNCTEEEQQKVKVIPIAAERSLLSFPPKEKLLTIVGRMVPEKGMLEAARAMAAVLPSYPDWQVKFIGARKFEDADPSAYEKKVAQALMPIRHQATMTGFIPSEKKQSLQELSAIALAPSQWQEPAGRVVLEALAVGAALITTRRGGIPEYAEGRAVVLKTGDVEELTDAIDRMIRDEDWRSGWQKKAWDDYPFSVENMVLCLDAARAGII